MSALPEDETPAQFSLLSESDQAGYRELRKRLSSGEYRYNRYHRLEALRDIFRHIRTYCIRGDNDDSLRCLVCGICWLSANEIAINIRYLHLLLNKAKATINGALAKMQYNPIPLKGDAADRLTSAIPQLKDNYQELRFWSVRRVSAVEEQFIVPVPISPASVPIAGQSKDGWDWPDFDFDIFDFSAEADVFLAAAEVVGSLGVMPDVIVERGILEMAREHFANLPRLLRSLFSRQRNDAITAESERLLRMPGDDDEMMRISVQKGVRERIWDALGIRCPEKEEELRKIQIREWVERVPYV
jgi:hypothetical protein